MRPVCMPLNARDRRALYLSYTRYFSDLSDLRGGSNVVCVSYVSYA